MTLVASDCRIFVWLGNVIVYAVSKLGVIPLPPRFDYIERGEMLRL